MTRTWKLSTFPKTFSEEEILLSPSDFPNLHANDVIEIYSLEEEEEEEVKRRLILEIQESSLSHHNSGGSPSVVSGNAIYVAKGIADAFGLRNYCPVGLRKLQEDEIPKLESLEVIFKEDYLGRSEMWRLKNHLLKESRCLHIAKRIHYSGIWVTVERLKGPGGVLQACGVVTPETKLIFRSLSAMVYLFIQMSSEMWGGTDYFDKIVDGFLSELFERWVQMKVVHDVTIVLFSRCYYKASSFDEFPEEMRSCVIKKNDGRFYEDFYRVVIQNERFTDWRPTLVQLRHLFPSYKRSLLDYHKSEGLPTPPAAYISSATEGNFLEVINMSLNTFDNHYHNRNLDRTGQQTIVITPGVGVYTVDRELALITKKRIIDSGVGSDLLCVGEQPLHSVPLFKFQSQDDTKGEYGIPHWIHLSFYTSYSSTSQRGQFIPRIKVPYDIVPNGINCPYIPGGHFDHPDQSSSEFFEQYDDFQFKKLSHPSVEENVRPGLLLFDPESESKRITSNRRRWTHIFSEYTNSSVLNTSMGVDWKSLTTPASLPITTDYFPDSKDIELKYVFNEYSLNPYAINDNFASSDGSDVKGYRNNMEVFIELISQRLAQGFQIVDLPSDKIKNSFMKKNAPQQRHHKEFWLSIGQIYHKVSLSENLQTIHVTRYSPRNPVQTSNHSYKYRFQAPDNNLYEVSWVQFNAQKLENFNWNHMDYYVCTRGDKDFVLTESLKYWRFRMHVLPLTPFIPYTKRIKDGSSAHCDIYECLDIHNSVREGMLKFAETCLNHIRRSKTSGCAFEKSTEKEDVVLYLKSKLIYLTNHETLPSNTFIAAEAIQFFLELRGFDFDQKAEIVGELEELRLSGVIKHASGNSEVPFVDGFVLFYFTDEEDSSAYYKGDVEAFHTEWVEIEFSGDKISSSLLEKTMRKHQREWLPESRSIAINIDSNRKSDRQEWGHFQYQAGADSDTAFELTLQWSVATGALISELVHGWSRKVQQMYGLFLIPVPSDPFALPVTPNSDPVRGPIFIELNKDFSEGLETQQTFLFRETIARRFGFIPCVNTQVSSSIFSTHHQYIHCTGNCFLLIPTQLKLNIGIQGYSSSTISSPPEDSEDFRPIYDHSKTGFLWSWNFMISQRWKSISNTGATGSIQFMDKLLADFRRFCKNEDGRLQRFWSECWES